MFWIATIGFAGSGFAILTYWMRDMFWLRIVAMLSCVFFIAYAAMIGSYPLILMELTLLPINAYRLLELQPQRRLRMTHFRRRPVVE
ncbi:YgjV family protein [Mesorhizobium sp. IMUNJ 23232]|uniref:YgjV family protein n=1 Tax=Mesorhizobium sp. IMUNJ 23232 TaxID=3376064 RepID=UPI0037ADA986